MLRSETIDLPDATVDLWRRELGELTDQLPTLHGILADDERRRAEHFGRPADRSRYVAARGLLRSLLARYLRVHPAGIRFDYGTHGKPCLRRDQGTPDLRFNVSHSGDLIMCAVVRGREIGVDVESHRPGIALTELAKRFFADGEAAALHAADPASREEVFFRTWVRKEAYLKAIGRGLSASLDAFEVTPADLPAALITSRVDSRGAHEWEVHDVKVGRHYSAALVVEAPILRVRYSLWGEDARPFCRVPNPLAIHARSS